jgi:hypothetical protein
VVRGKHQKDKHFKIIDMSRVKNGGSKAGGKKVIKKGGGKSDRNYPPKQSFGKGGKVPGASTYVRPQSK